MGKRAQLGSGLSGQLGHGAQLAMSGQLVRGAQLVQRAQLERGQLGQRG